MDTRFGNLALRANPAIDEDVVKKWSSTLNAAYSEPHRHYHTAEHISFMLQAALRPESLPYNSIEVELATWFHDAVYDPTREDNEEKSTELFSSFAEEAQLDAETRRIVSAMIMASKDHAIPLDFPTDKEGELRLFLDLDMLILAEDKEAYDTYARQVRAEYQHLSDRAYQIGRVKFLRGVMKRDRVFLLDTFHEQSNFSARQNMSNEEYTLCAYPRPSKDDEQFRGYSSYQFVPKDIPQYLKNYGRVQAYVPGTTYEQSYIDEDGYTWKLQLHEFRHRDDELCCPGTFVSNASEEWVAYKLEPTEEQQEALQRYCSCPIHTKVADHQKPLLGCACCAGCLHTEFPSQGNLIQAIARKSQEEESDKVPASGP